MSARLLPGAKRLGVLTGLLCGLFGVTFVRGSAGVVRECAEDGARCHVAAGLAGMALSAVVAALLVGGLWLAVARRRGRRGRLGAGLAAMAAALLAATPVEAGWKACNDHSATLAAGVAVVTVIAQPEEPRLEFTDLHTLMACSAPMVLRA